MLSCIYFFPFLQNTLTLGKQIKLFTRVIKNNLPHMFDEKEKLERHLSESLFVVSTGVNDNLVNRGSRNFSSYLLKEFSLRLQVYVTEFIVLFNSIAAIIHSFKKKKTAIIHKQTLESTYTYGFMAMFSKISPT
jgi:hypothetical protein